MTETPTTRYGTCPQLHVPDYAACGEPLRVQWFTGEVGEGGWLGVECEKCGYKRPI